MINNVALLDLKPKCFLLKTAGLRYQLCGRILWSVTVCSEENSSQKNSFLTGMTVLFYYYCWFYFSCYDPGVTVKDFSVNVSEAFPQ